MKVFNIFLNRLGEYSTLEEWDAANEEQNEAVRPSPSTFSMNEDLDQDGKKKRSK